MKPGGLEKLESLLHYLLVQCESAVAGMPELQRSTLRANVYCAAAEAFISRKATEDLKSVLMSGG